MSRAGRVVVASAAGMAQGSKPAAAALACRGATADGVALLLELTDGRGPKPALVASASARALEERLAGHLPEANVAARGAICHLALPASVEGLEMTPRALDVAGGRLAVLHVPPTLFEEAIASARIRASAALLRANLAADRPLVGLAARRLLAREMAVAVVKAPLPWLAARMALLGTAAPGSSPEQRLIARFAARLLGSSG